MKKTLVLLAILLVARSGYSQKVTNVNFNDYFSEKTMRVDLFHSGNATEEHFAVDRILSDGPWAGSETILLDDLNRGPYFFEVKDKKTSTLLYTRGFGSLFGEWQTTDDAKENWGTFHESIRFPWPSNPVEVVLKKRDASNNFVKIWEREVDPSSRIVNPAENHTHYKVFKYLDNGSPVNKVDIVILGDGYTTDEMEKFERDVVKLADALFGVEPFRARKNDFNVSAIETPSESTGVNKPDPGVFKRSFLSVSYGAFNSERYALAYDNRTIRDVAATVPYDYMFILVNERTYGGGGIFNLYAISASDNKFSDYIFVHEFGHCFAALGDEYYTSDVSYEKPNITVEPWEPNITALLKNEPLKWGQFVSKDTPIPTPWNKTDYDSFSYEIQKQRRELRSKKVPEGEMEDLFLSEKEKSMDILDNMKYSGKVGAFEGAGYQQYGLYRPFADCIMFTRDRQLFCPVCQDAISQVIDMYTK